MRTSPLLFLVLAACAPAMYGETGLEDTGPIDDIDTADTGLEDTGDTEADADTDADADSDTDADGDADADTDSDTDADTDVDEWSDYIYVNSYDEVCFSEQGINMEYRGDDVFFVGYGEYVDWDVGDDGDAILIEPGDDYCLSMDALEVGETYEGTIISAVDEDGDAITSYGQTADWWDNYNLCTSGSVTADEWCTYQGGDSYLIAFVYTSSGMPVPAGDGADID